MALPSDVFARQMAAHQRLVAFRKHVKLALQQRLAEAIKVHIDARMPVITVSRREGLRSIRMLRLEREQEEHEAFRQETLQRVRTLAWEATCMTGDLIRFIVTTLLSLVAWWLGLVLPAFTVEAVSPVGRHAFRKHVKLELHQRFAKAIKVHVEAPVPVITVSRGRGEGHRNIRRLPTSFRVGRRDSCSPCGRTTRGRTVSYAAHMRVIPTDGYSPAAGPTRAARGPPPPPVVPNTPTVPTPSDSRRDAPGAFFRSLATNLRAQLRRHNLVPASPSVSPPMVSVSLGLPPSVGARGLEPESPTEPPVASSTDTVPSALDRVAPLVEEIDRRIAELHEARRRLQDLSPALRLVRGLAPPEPTTPSPQAHLPMSSPISTVAPSADLDSVSGSSISSSTSSLASSYSRHRSRRSAKKRRRGSSTRVQQKLTKQSTYFRLADLDVELKDSAQCQVAFQTFITTLQNVLDAVRETQNVFRKYPQIQPPKHAFASVGLCRFLVSKCSVSAQSKIWNLCQRMGRDDGIAALLMLRDDYSPQDPSRCFDLESSLIRLCYTPGSSFRAFNDEFNKRLELAKDAGLQYSASQQVDCYIRGLMPIWETHPLVTSWYSQRQSEMQSNSSETALCVEHLQRELQLPEDDILAEDARLWETATEDRAHRPSSACNSQRLSNSQSSRRSTTTTARASTPSRSAGPCYYCSRTHRVSECPSCSPAEKRRIYDEKRREERRRQCDHPTPGPSSLQQRRGNREWNNGAHVRQEVQTTFTTSVAASSEPNARTESKRVSLQPASNFLPAMVPAEPFTGTRSGSPLRVEGSRGFPEHVTTNDASTIAPSTDNASVENNNDDATISTIGSFQASATPVTAQFGQPPKITVPPGFGQSQVIPQPAHAAAPMMIGRASSVPGGNSMVPPPPGFPEAHPLLEGAIPSPAFNTLDVAPRLSSSHEPFAGGVTFGSVPDNGLLVGRMTAPLAGLGHNQGNLAGPTNQLFSGLPVVAPTPPQAQYRVPLNILPPLPPSLATAVPVGEPFDGPTIGLSLGGSPNNSQPLDSSVIDSISTGDTFLPGAALWLGQSRGSSLLGNLIQQNSAIEGEQPCKSNIFGNHNSDSQSSHWGHQESLGRKCSGSIIW